MQYWNILNEPSSVYNELQFYNPYNVKLNNIGKVILSEMKTIYGNRPYTSGRVDTRNKFELLYGTVEWSAKLPINGKGLLASLSLVQYKCKPTATVCNSPQIDILRANCINPYKIKMGVYNGSSILDEYELSSSTIDYSTAYHTFGISWNPSQLSFIVDGNIVFNLTDTNKIPNQRMYLASRIECWW